jgi:uncharacterized protein YndB with AHSA1/START domain
MKNKLENHISTHIDATPETVWNALTDPKQIKKYFFGTDTHTSWEPGTSVRFTGEWEGKSYEDKGTVIENIRNKKLTYNYWSSMSGMEDKPENYANITYEIQPEDNGTKLTVIQDNIPDEKMKEHSAENWRMVLDGLKKMLEKEYSE